MAEYKIDPRDYARSYTSSRWGVLASKATCWRCSKETRVHALVAPPGTMELTPHRSTLRRADEYRLLGFLEKISESVREPLLVLAPTLKHAVTRGSGTTYYANHCEHCHAVQGDHFLHGKSPVGVFRDSAAWADGELQVIEQAAVARAYPQLRLSLDEWSLLSVRRRRLATAPIAQGIDDMAKLLESPREQVTLSTLRAALHEGTLLVSIAPPAAGETDAWITALTKDGVTYVLSYSDPAKVPADLNNLIRVDAVTLLRSVAYTGAALSINESVTVPVGRACYVLEDLVPALLAVERAVVEARRAIGERFEARFARVQAPGKTEPVYAFVLRGASERVIHHVTQSIAQVSIGRSDAEIVLLVDTADGPLQGAQSLRSIEEINQRDVPVTKTLENPTRVCVARFRADLSRSSETGTIGYLDFQKTCGGVEFRPPIQERFVWHDASRLLALVVVNGNASPYFIAAEDARADCSPEGMSAARDAAQRLGWIK